MKSDVDMLAAALLWLRNHYDVCPTGPDREPVLSKIDASDSRESTDFSRNG